MLHARLCTAAELEAGCGYGMGCETRWREWVIPDRESERPPTRVNRVLPYDNQSHWSSSTVRPALTGARLALLRRLAKCASSLQGCIVLP
eukprot:COSAG04_NODE_23836_length_331_cov_0.875000_1_plen_89_part_10